MSRPRLALVGVGRMGTIRAGLLKDTNVFDVKYVVDMYEEGSKKVAETFGEGCKAVKELNDEVLDNVDAVWVASSTTAHPDHIQTALNAGKPTFTEKPVALTKKEIQECYRIAHQSEVPLMVGFQRRHAGPFKDAKKAIPTKDIYSCHFVNRDNPMPDPKILHLLGGIYDDFAVHDIDMALFVMEEKPLRVSTHGLATYGGEDPAASDNCTFVMEFSGGRSVTVTASRFSSSEYDQRMEIMGKDKTVKADMGAEYSFGQCYHDAYKTEVIAFAELVVKFHAGQTEIKPERPYDHCLWISDVIEALKESASKGGAIVDVPSGDSPVQLSILGRGDFSTYTQGLLGQNRRERVETQRVHHTSYLYEPVPEVDMVYVCTPDKLHTQHVHEALDSGKHVLCEKPGFLSVQDYQFAAQKARRKGLYVQLNFQRRHDKLYQDARDLIQAQTGDNVTVHLEARDPVPHHEDPNFVVHNSLIHEIDTAVWCAWPFVSVGEPEIAVTDNVFTATMTFFKADQQQLTFNVTFSKDHTSYLNRVTIEGVENGVFENDHAASPWQDRYSDAYLASWDTAIDYVTKARQGDHSEIAEASLLHPTFFYTYSILEKMLARV